MTEPTDAGGATLLRDYLNSQRKHVLGIIEGLDEQAMRRPVLPSGWTCLGLVNHLALDVERFWFRAAVAAEQAVIDDLAVSQEDAWHAGPDVSVEAVLERYRDEIERANVIIQATSIDAAPAWWPDFFGDWRMDDLREILLHVIIETACHAGHLDAARELIDGKQWLVLTD